MPAFYNRHPWNLVIGFTSVGGIVVAMAAMTSWWFLMAPVGLIAILHLWRQAQRVYGLATRKYHVDTIEVDRLRYEERSATGRRFFTLALNNTEPGRYELFVPDERDWARKVPEWAQSRRAEIAMRIATSWRCEDVHVDGSP